MTRLLFTVGPPPNMRSGARFERMNYEMFAALIPALIAAVVLQGWQAARVALTAVGMAMAFEYIAARVMKQPIRIGNGHTALMGLLLALLLPPSVPWWLVVVAAGVCIVIGKQVFGGVGGYLLHPVLVGWAICLLSWPHHMFPIKHLTLGTAYLPLIIAGGVYATLRGLTSWRITLSFLLGVLLSAWVLRSFCPQVEIAGPWVQITTGSVMLCAFFLATEYSSSPANPWPQVIFGLSAGIMVMVLRVWGIWPDPSPLAVLLLNLVHPLLDRIRSKPRKLVTVNA